MRIVSIDTKQHIYTLVENGKVVDKIKSDRPLTAEMVEIFRTSELEEELFVEPEPA